MSVFVVSYDLKAPGRNYDRLYEALKKFAYARPLESFWLIESNGTAGSIRDTLKQHVDANDKIVVIEFTQNAGWATLNISKPVMEWWKQRRP